MALRLPVRTRIELRGHRYRHPREELVRLVRTRRHPQRVEREARVADPGVPVIPVPLAAHVLGQRGGRRSDDGPGGLVRQRLEHAAAVIDEVAPRPLVGLVQRRPRLPLLDGPGEEVLDLSLRERLLRGLLGGAALHGERGGLSGRQPEPEAGGGPLDAGSLGRRQHGGLGSSPGGQATINACQQRIDQPVLGPGRELHFEFDLSVDALHASKHHSGRARAQVGGVNGRSPSAA